MIPLFTEWLEQIGVNPAAPAPIGAANNQPNVAASMTAPPQTLSAANAWMPPALQQQYITPKDATQQQQLFSTQLNNYIRYAGRQAGKPTTNWESITTGGVTSEGQLKDTKFNLTKKDNAEEQQFGAFSIEEIMRAGDWLIGNEVQQ